MKCHDILACKEWCESRSINVLGNGRLYYPSPAAAVKIPMPRIAEQIFALVYALSAYEHEESPFSGGLLLFTDWGIWSESTEEYALRIWRNMRRAYGEERPPAETPGHLFDAHELIDLQSFLLLPLLFQWDAFLIPNHGKYFTFVSHDDFLYLNAREDHIYAKLLEDFNHWGSKTKPLV